MLIIGSSIFITSRANLIVVTNYTLIEKIKITISAASALRTVRRVIMHTHVLHALMITIWPTQPTFCFVSRLHTVLTEVILSNWIKQPLVNVSRVLLIVSHANHQLGVLSASTNGTFTIMSALIGAPLVGLHFLVALVLSVSQIVRIARMRLHVLHANLGLFFWRIQPHVLFNLYVQEVIT